MIIPPEVVSGVGWPGVGAAIEFIVTGYIEDLVWLSLEEIRQPAISELCDSI